MVNSDPLNALYEGHISVDMLSSEAAYRLTDSLQGTAPEGVMGTVRFEAGAGVPQTR